MKENDREEAAEAAFVITAKRSLIDAIVTAEKRAKGSAIEAGLEIEDGKTFYEVTTRSKFGVFETKIDAATSMVLSAEREDDDDQESIQERHEGDATMLDAVKAAETSTGGKAMEAELEDEDGKRFFEIELASADGSIKIVAVDAKTRSVTPMVDDETEDSVKC